MWSLWAWGFVGFRISRNVWQRAQALHRGSSRRAGIRFPEETGSRRGSSLNFADNTDARMETFREILTGSATTDEWLGYNRFVDSNVRRTTEF